MSKSRALGFVSLLTVILFSGLSYAATPDRINGDLASGQKVPITGNMHGLVRPENDLGRADGNRMIERLSLNFKLSPAQQKDLDQFLVQLGDPHSANFHKYLTIPQYASRFGMSQNDVDKVTAWLQSQGFTNIKIAPTRNSVKFDGTVAQIESLFAIEMHNYLVDGVVHLANASNPSLPVALSGAVQYVGHLNDFAPKPRVKVNPHFTSYVSGNHFLTPADFATIYDLGSLYTAGGSNQKIVIVGQSTVATSDLNNFRSAAGLPASTVTMQLIEGTMTRCSGDEGESDLDIEWSGGVAQKAQITFMYAGLGPGDSCSNRGDSVWDALEEALTGVLSGSPVTPVAPFVSTSYGYCETLLQQQDPGFPATIRTWVTTGQTLGVTLVSASGDAGAADCDSGSTATHGLAVDVPASIPEVTGAGGNEFDGDPATCTTDCAPGGDAYWAAAGASTDTISSALKYIPEEAWNDSSEAADLSASGGGVSTLFAKPSWQTGTGVPSGSFRFVPDISLTTSQYHDPYLICSEDGGSSGIVQSCTDGFRTGAGGNLTAVGGTSAAAPTFTAILALLNQDFGNAPPTGLAPVNPMLYQLAANTASGAFHDVTSGNNIVSCVTGTTNCTSGSMGFSAGTGYDEVTGLGSVDATKFATAWAATLAGFSLAPSPASLSAVAGQNTGSTTITITPQNGFTGTVSFACSSGLPSGATCKFGPPSSTSVTLYISTTLNMAAASNVAVTVTGTSGAVSSTTTVNLTVTATSETYTLGPAPGSTLTVAQGQTTGSVTLTVTSTNGFIVGPSTNQTTALPLTYTCANLPLASTCNFTSIGTGTNSTTTSATSLTFTITTTAPTGRLQNPLGRASQIFYALLLPGLFGIVFTVGTRKRSWGAMRMLGLIAVLGVSTLWMASCGGSSSNVVKNPGTPLGTTTVTVNATTGGSAPITGSTSFQLTVSQ
jgi:subtilase family serine protease